MRSWGLGVLILLLGACTTTTTSGDDDPDGGGVITSCDDTAPFGAPTAVTSVNTAANELDPRLTADELTIYFHRDGSDDLFEATRTDAGGAFGTATELAMLNTGSGIERAPSVTSSNLEMVFASDRGGTFDLFLADRGNLTEEFSVVSQIVATNTGFAESSGFVSANGNELWLESDRTGAQLDLFRATRSGGGAFGTTTAVAELNTAGEESSPVISQDGLTIMFSRDGDIFSASRTAVGQPFTGIAEVTELNGASNDSPSWLSSGACRIYFHSDRTGAQSDVFVAERPET